MTASDKPLPPTGSQEPPPGFKQVYQGVPLPAFYAAEMLRPHVGKTVWVKDSGGRLRQGELKMVPNLRENQTEGPPVEFADERPLYLRDIVAIAVYEQWGQDTPRMGKRGGR